MIIVFSGSEDLILCLMCAAFEGDPVDCFEGTGTGIEARNCTPGESCAIRINYLLFPGRFT